MVSIKAIDEKEKVVTFDNDTEISHTDFIKKFMEFWKGRIAGETITHDDMERFMSRTSSKNLKLLMKGKKMEGFLEGSQGKFLTRGQKIAIGGIATIIIVVLIVVVVLRGQGMI